jgi:WD40 repeat protein
MAAPKVLTDVALEAGEVFTLNMVNETSWAFDALAYKANAAGAVSILLADPTERFLIAGTKDGEMKVWGLMSNPVVELMKYSAHQSGVYAAGFLKSGTHVASCDGSIRIWDIQTGMTIADLQRSHSELDVFSHLHVVSPRLGVGSDMSKRGDDQLMTCAGAVLAHYDIRVGYMCSLNPISEWKLYTNFSSSKI